MGKLVGLFLVAVSVYVGLTLYDEGLDRAFGGFFHASGTSAPSSVAVPLEPDDPGAADRAADARVARDSGRGSSQPGAVTQRVRERVTGAMNEGARRHGGP